MPAGVHGAWVECGQDAAAKVRPSAVVRSAPSICAVFQSPPVTSEPLNAHRSKVLPVRRHPVMTVSKKLQPANGQSMNSQSVICAQLKRASTNSQRRNVDVVRLASVRPAPEKVAPV